MAVKRLVIVILSLALLAAVAQAACGTESERNLGEPQYRNVAKVIRPPDITDAQLAKVKKIAVLVTSGGAALGQVAEDLFAVKLMDLGYDVAQGTQFAEATEKEWSKFQAEAQQQEKTQTPQQLQTPNVFKVGRQLGLDAVVVATLIEGSRQVSLTKDNPPQMITSVVVSIFYFQLVDIQTEKVLLAGALDYGKGESVVGAIDVAASIVRQEKGK